MIGTSSRHAAANDPGAGRAQHGERVQGSLGSQFLDDADQRVRDQDTTEQRVVQGTDDDDDHEQSAEQEVERREDVGPHDLADGATAGDGQVVRSPGGVPLGDFSFGQTLTGAPPLHLRHATAGYGIRYRGRAASAFVGIRASSFTDQGQELIVELSVGSEPMSTGRPTATGQVGEPTTGLLDDHRDRGEVVQLGRPGRTWPRLDRSRRARIRTRLPTSGCAAPRAARLDTCRPSTH